MSASPSVQDAFTSCAHISKRTRPWSVQHRVRVPSTRAPPSSSQRASLWRTPNTHAPKVTQARPTTHTKGGGDKQDIIHFKSQASPPGRSHVADIRTYTLLLPDHISPTRPDLPYSVYRHGPRPYFPWRKYRRSPIAMRRSSWK